ncbi:MAG: hypothetical protein J0I54_12705 [Bosea sp.]|uniref:hypothetical protein n=1 Tax=unclassified Bosea (in: a-proteobacteria) TaxID=2653178 RepID=UPI001AD57583|nr:MULTISPECIES: hypothetical protein [unclassified Bosea (in: a-proteobacteria)]MBN9457481.1 hypothetical protein [Bosea sp. (in: a-proteobacteria)]
MKAAAHMRIRLTWAGGCGIALALASGAYAQGGWRDVYSCGASKGQSFFLNGQGWQDDGISSGVIVLKRRGDDFDIRVADASGSSFSAREDGASVIGRAQDGVIQVLVVYPSMTIETFLFSKPDKGRSVLAWTASKQVYGLADRASVFVSSCITR